MKPDLRTRYVGLELRHPLVVSACPLSENEDTLRQLVDAGAAAVVFPSLFEEQLEQEELELHGLYESGTDSFAESLTFFPELREYNVGPSDWLRRIERAKAAVDVPIIGSLNGTSSGGWTRFARLIEEAGADALELNVYSVPADPTMTAGSVERAYLDLIAEVRSTVNIPLTVKLAPFFTAFANMAKRVVEAGANGLVLFNRFVHPDIDIDDRRVTPRLQLSTSYDALLPMTWIAILRGRIHASLAASGGVHTATDAIKMIMAGADVTMMASTLYRNGPEHIGRIRDDLERWLVEHEYDSVEQMKGCLSQEHCPDPVAFERVGYMKTITSFSSGR